MHAFSETETNMVTLSKSSSHAHPGLDTQLLLETQRLDVLVSKMTWKV